MKKQKKWCRNKLDIKQIQKKQVPFLAMMGSTIGLILFADTREFWTVSSRVSYIPMETRALDEEVLKLSESANETANAVENQVSEKKAGFFYDGSALFYYNEDGSLYQGWLLWNENWYYFTEHGAATGYQTISEYGREDECFFQTDGRLAVNMKTPDGRWADGDGYLIDPQDEAAILEAWSEFEVEASRSMLPGALSGIRVSGEPAEFYMLAIAGESSGGQITMGDRGRAYGLCQFDYRYDLINFIKWAYERHPSLWKEFEAFTEKTAGEKSLVDNPELLQAFLNARHRDYEATVSDELEFMRQTYWDPFAAKMNAAGFHLSERHISVSAAFFSVNVNCGNHVDVFLKQLSPDMSDAEMICAIYKIRNTILAEQMVGGRKKGTTARYRMAEPRMALDLLHGFTTIDSVRNYGGGVQWNGDLFADTVRTQERNGTSTEWEETMLATPADVNPVNSGNAIPESVK